MAGPTDMIVYDSSMRPSASKSIVRKFADLATFGHATDLLRGAERQVGVPHMAALMHTIRANAEGGLTGGLLAAVSGTGGLVRNGVPVDLTSSAVCNALGVLMARSEFGVTFRNMGANAMAIFMFRMTEEWLGVRKKAGFHGDDWNDPDTINTTADVDIGSDPIMQAAEGL